MDAHTLNELQVRLYTLFAQLPSGIEEIEGIFTANGSYEGLVRAHQEFRHPQPILNELRDQRSRLLLRESQDGHLVRCRTHLSIGTAPIALRNGGKLCLRKPATEEEFREAVSHLDLAAETVRAAGDRAGWNVRLLRAKDLARYFDEVVNPDRTIRLNERTRTGPDVAFLDSYLREYIDTAVEGCQGTGIFQIGDCYHTIVTLLGKPLVTEPRIIERVSSHLPFRQMRYLWRLRKLDELTQKAKLQKARRAGIEAKKRLCHRWTTFRAIAVSTRIAAATSGSRRGTWWMRPICF